MSSPRGAQRRRSSTLPRAPLVALALLLTMTATLVIRAGSLADPGRAAIHLTADAAGRAGLWLEFLTHTDLPARVLELRGAVFGRPEGRSAILAASRDGARVALADRQGQDPTTLVIADAGGDQLRVPFDGLLAAAFAPDGSWLAVADGLGRLWQVDAVDGGTSLLADGPFAGSLTVESNGAVLALAVPSVEAPFMSRLVRLLPDGSQTNVSDEELVYDARPLRDGALAVVAHRPSGTVLQRLADGTTETVLDLGPGAVHVAVAVGLQLVAWERDGHVFGRDAGGRVTRIAAGVRPRVSDDGRLILVDGAAGAVAYAPDGSMLAAFEGPALLLGCEECAS